MITAAFEQSKGTLTGVSVHGHAGYADSGEDIVCASVSASVQTVANLLTEIYQIPAAVAVEDNRIHVQLPVGCTDGNGELLLRGLLLQMQLLQEEFPDYVQVQGV